MPTTSAPLGDSEADDSPSEYDTSKSFLALGRGVRRGEVLGSGVQPGVVVLGSGAPRGVRRAVRRGVPRGVMLAGRRRRPAKETAWRFLKRGFCDLNENIKRTWPLILAFVGYLFGSASILYGCLRASAQIPSWLHALYSTWISMSTAGELTTKSSKWVLALGAANSFVGLLFFGFIVWLVTTSLYQSPD